MVGQPKDVDPKEAIAEHFADCMQDYKDRMEIEWKELAAASGVTNASRWGNGEILPATVNLYKLHQFAREEAGLATNFFDVRLEPDPTYTTRKAVKFLKQETFDLGSDPTLVAYQRMPVGIYEGLRELAQRFPAQDGTFEIIGPEEEPYYQRSGPKVEAGLHMSAAGLESQLHAAESLDTFTWHAAGADRTPSTAVEFASRSINHMQISRMRQWSKIL